MAAFSISAAFMAIDQFTRPVSLMQRRIRRMLRGVNAGLSRIDRATSAVGRGIRNVGVAATVAGIAIAAAIAKVTLVGAEFEQTLVNAAAKFPGEITKTTNAFKKLEAAALKTGSTTEFSATESAQALNFLAMAGFNAESAISALPGVVDLATAAQVDLATATDVASDSLGAFGLMSKDAQKLGINLARVNDVIAKTTTSANTTVEAMFETIKEGASTATASGASIETFAALTGQLANSGIKGGSAGTVLKNMFIRLQAPVPKAAKWIKKLGININDSSGNMKDMVDILGQFENKTKKLSGSQKTQALSTIFGLEAISGVNILLATGANEIEKYRKSLESATGSSTKMASVMRNTVLGRLKSLGSAIEGVTISIFQMSNVVISDAIDKMIEFVRVMGPKAVIELAKGLAFLVNNFQDIIKWSKRIGIAIAAFTAFVVVLKTFILIMTAVNILMALNPIGLIVIGVLAAVAAFSALVFWIDEVRRFFREMPPSMQALYAPLIGWIEIIKLVKDNWEEITDTVGDFFLSIDIAINKTISAFTRLFNIAKSGFNSIRSGFTAATDFLGFGDSQQDANATAQPSIISPQDRITKMLEERRNTSTSEVTIKDETGQAEVTKGPLGSGLSLTNTGAFNGME